MLHGLLASNSSYAAAAAASAFAIGAQLLGTKVGALHAVESIDGIDHWGLREGTH